MARSAQCPSWPRRFASIPERSGWPDPRRGKAVDNGGLRYGAVEGALRPPLPTATQSALHNPTLLLGLRRPKSSPRLTKPPRRNIIASIRESERWVAGFKSERWPASDRNRWPASYWNAWPASSESAILTPSPDR